MSALKFHPIIGVFCEANCNGEWKELDKKEGEKLPPYLDLVTKHEFKSFQRNVSIKRVIIIILYYLFII